MNLPRTALPLLALAMAFSMAACHSNSSQSANPQNPPAAQSPQPTAPEQPASTASAPTTAASTSAPAPTAAAPAPAPPPPPAVVVLPTGTQVRVRLDQDLGSKISNPGDSFSATVSDDVVVNGTTVIPRGARADGTVVDARPLGRFKGGAELVVRLERVHTRWGSYPVATSSVSRVEAGKGKRSAAFIGGGAGLGALIGGLAGGGRGALIGAAAGGGAGTAGSAFTGNKQIVLPAETMLTFRLERSIHITE